MIVGILNHMKKKKQKIKLVILCLILACTAINCKQESKDKKIEYKIFEVDNHWGYDITINNKIFIHQDIIPAINKSVSFYNKEDAEKVAKLVIEKIKKKQMPPAISKEEIEKLGIKTDS